MKFKIKIFKKFLSAFLAAVLFFQPFFAVQVLAEEEITESQTVAENSQTGTDSSSQATADTDQTTNVQNENTVSVENNVEVSANTGNNSVTSEPLAGPVVEETPTSSPQATPDPSSIPSLEPTLEQTSEPVATGSSSQIEVIAQNNQTGEDSENIASASAETSMTIMNNNQVELTNTATISAQSGENQASGSGTIIESGEATVSANLANIVNTNLVGSDFWQVIFNLFDSGEDGLNLTQLEAQEASVNLALADFLSSLSVYSTNSATLTNNISLFATSSRNQAVGDGSLIKTGTASAQLNLFNLVNTNLTGKNWFFGIINLFAKLRGDIILPYELQFLGEDEEGDSQNLATNQNIAEGSQNQAQATVENTLEIRNTNEATLTNNVSVLANSGENAIVGGGSIQTGEAQASANLVNIINTNIVGSRWLFLLINNFGNWTGNLLGWWGNLVVSPGWTLAWVRLNGEEVDQNPQVVAANEDTGENSQNQASSQATPSLVVENTNTATVENNISVVADSGGNQIEGESASIQTGQAQASANVFNFLNTNIIGNNWFFGIVNIFDEFLGNIIFPRPDLAIGKTADKEVVRPGEEITYTVSYKNQGHLSAKNTIIEDILSLRVTFVSVSDGGAYQDGKVVWNLAKVWPRDAGSFTLVVRVNADTPEGTQLVNTAQIATSTDEPNKDNNSSSALVLVSISISPPLSPPTPTPPSPSPVAEGVGGPTAAAPQQENELSAIPTKTSVLGVFEGLPQVLGALLPEGELLKEALATEAGESLEVSVEEKPRPADFGRFWPVLAAFIPLSLLFYFRFYLRR